MTRYLLGTPSPWEIALSLAPRAYLSHRTAAQLQGLWPGHDRTITVNHEQSPKPARAASLTQDAIDRAFARPQRASAYVLRYREFEIIRTNGKHTNRLGVICLPGPDRVLLDVTDLERTLIDVVVRPLYAGGVIRVRDIFRAAKPHVSPRRLFQYLRSMNFIYPYHQAIGFYLERTGYPEKAYKPLLQLPRQFKFYLAHNLKRPLYDEHWQIFHPRDFGAAP